MDLARLSVRSAWNTGWRRWPPPVHSEKVTSAINAGFTQCTPRSETRPLKGDWVAASFFSFELICASEVSLKPLPTFPA